MPKRKLPKTELDTPCIEWQGKRNPQGYGWDGTKVAHRAAWERVHGPIPAGMFVCHRCDNPPCCNVEHLFLGSSRDNILDKVAKGRHHWQTNREYAVRAAKIGASLPQRKEQLARARAICAAKRAAGLIVIRHRDELGRFA